MKSKKKKKKENRNKNQIKVNFFSWPVTTIDFRL